MKRLVKAALRGRAGRSLEGQGRRIRSVVGHGGRHGGKLHVGNEHEKQRVQRHRISQDRYMSGGREERSRKLAGLGVGGDILCVCMYKGRQGGVCGMRRSFSLLQSKVLAEQWI